jgi:hypothetical protein
MTETSAGSGGECPRARVGLGLLRRYSFVRVSIRQRSGSSPLCQKGAMAHGRACLSFRYSVAAPMPSFSAALARLPPEARSAAAM